MIAQRGYLLISVIVTLFIISGITLQMSQESLMQSRLVNDGQQQNQLRYVTEAAMQHAEWNLKQQGCGPFTDLTSTSFGNHSYASTITPNKIGGSINSYTVNVIEDAYIDEDNPTQNYANEAQLKVKKNLSTLDDMRSLYRFDMDNSGVPNGANVVSAVARFYVIDPHTMASIKVHRINASWNENTVNWNNINDGYESSTLDTISIAPTAGEYVEVNITSLVQGWLNNSIPNQGIMLRISFSLSSDLAQFSSKEYSDSSVRPELIIKVSDGSLSDHANISATSTLDNNKTQTLTRKDIKLYQATPSTINWQPGNELQDTFIWDGAHKRKNFGISPILNIKSDRNVLIRFALEAIPPGAHISDAKLELYLEDGSSVNNGILDLHALSRTWVEGIYDDADPPTGEGATYEEHDGGNNWNTSGGDYNPTIIDTITLPNMIPGWYQWNVTEQIKSWLEGSTNHGFLLRKGGGDVGDIDFVSSDNTTTPEWHPKLTITLGCQCGISCLIPQGSGNVLLAVGNDNNLSPKDSQKKSIFESWGYTVSLIDDGASQSTFNSSFNNNDVVFASETINSWVIGSKLNDANIGVITEEKGLLDNLGISSSNSEAVGHNLTILDNTHFITAIFPLVSLPIYNADMKANLATGTLSDDLKNLASFSATPSLALLDTGDKLADGNSNAPARRLTVPLSSDFNWDYLNNNGRLIIQRAIEWGTGGGVLIIGNVLMVVSDSNSLNNEDDSKKALIQSFGYSVTLIDDDESQATFDSSISANDIIYLTDSIADGTLKDKITNTTIGIVNESGKMLNEFGFSSDKQPNTASLKLFNNTNVGHYISAPFADNSIQPFTTNLVMPIVTGTLAPGLKQAASFNATTPALPTLDTGAIRWDNAPSSGRRVFLPFGDAKADQLTDDGKTIFKRSLEWASGENLPGPVAHWELNETNGITAVDSEGNHDGKLVNDPSWDYGAIAGGVRFNDNLHAITVPHDDSLSINQQLTLMSWVYIENFQTNRAIIHKGTSNTDQNYYLGLNDSKIQFGLSPDAGGLNNVLTESVILLNTWHHVAVTFDNSSDKVIFYLDGIKITEKTTSITPQLNSGDVHIGRNENGDGFFGRLDEVRIYNRMLAASEITELAVRPIKKIYWADDNAGKIMRSDEDGNNVEKIIDGQLNIKGLDIDTTNGKIYWTSNLFIRRANLNGSNIEAIKLDPFINLDIKLDVAANKMYWTHDSNSSFINRANLDGSNSETINNSLKAPTFITLDTANAHLYVTDFISGNISRMNTDGSSTTTLIQGPVGVVGNAVDLKGKKIYWSSGANGDWIKRADLDGNNEETIITGLNAPQDIAFDVDNNRIYWADGILPPAIKRANADGSNVQTIVSSGLIHPRGILVVDANLVSANIGGPSAHWKLDETSGNTALDSIASNNGVLINGPVWGAGVIDGGLLFDGFNDYINVSTMNPTAYNDVTLSVWYKSTGSTINNDEYIFDHNEDNNNTINFAITSDGSGGGIIRFGFTQGDSSQWDPHYSNTNIVDKEWHHLVGVRANGRIKIYVNGVLETDDLDAHAAAVITVDGEGPFIGGQLGSVNQVNATLDDIRLYDKALSAAEILTIFSDVNTIQPIEGNGCNGTYQDNFDNFILNGSNGSFDWSGSAWVEVGESDGVKSGDIQIREDDNGDNHQYRLRIRDNNNGGEGVAREVDLTGASNAILSFDYRRKGLDNSSDYVAVFASKDGTDGSWEEIPNTRITGGATDKNYLFFTVDISDYISANTSILLRSSSSMGNTDTVWFDNFQIKCSP